MSSSNPAAATQKRLTHSELLHLHLKRLEARIMAIKEAIIQIDPSDRTLALRLAKLQGRYEELTDIQVWLLKEMDI